MYLITVVLNKTMMESCKEQKNIHFFKEKVVLTDKC